MYKFIALILVAFLLVKTFLHSQKTILKSGRKFKNYENQFDTSACGGVERWKIKVFTDSLANTIDFTPKQTTIQWLTSKSVPTSYFTMPRYQPLEDSTYMVTCFITIKKVESDSDYHLVLSDTVNTMIGEIPNPTCASVAASPKASEFTAARNWVDANIAAGNVYNVNLPPVVVTGVAFIDTAHGQTGAAPNQVELHSILDIHFASITATNEIPSMKMTATVVPNPFSSSATINISSSGETLNDCVLKIFNSAGAEVKEIRIPPGNSNKTTFTIHRGNLKPGVYIYHFISKDPLFAKVIS